MTDTQMDVEQMLEDVEARARKIINEPTERAGTSAASHLIKYNGRDMPERIPAFRRLTGKQVFLPTANIGYFMAKRHSDGSKVFVRTQEQCLQQPQPIDETCDICKRREINKKFFNAYDLEAHMDSFHPREWGILQRENDRAERKEEREIMRAMIERGQAKEVATEFTCAACGKAFQSEFALSGHQKTHMVRSEK